MRDEITGDTTSDVASDVTWMSYADLGRARGISAASAKRLAIRRHWRRHQGNDGTARVVVPVTEATARETRPSDATSDDTGDVTGHVTALEAALATLREAHAGETAALHAVIAAKDAELATVRGMIEGLSARTDRAEAGRDADRARADALRERIEALQVQLTARQEVIDAAEATRRAEDERKARGRWARLRAAWRGE